MSPFNSPAELLVCGSTVPGDVCEEQCQGASGDKQTSEPAEQSTTLEIVCSLR